MSLYQQTLNSLSQARDKRINGDSIAIPWHGLQRLSRVLPGITPEQYTIITAASKCGKSQITDFLYVMQPIEWLFNHRDSNLDIDIQYFSLEMSKEAKMRQAMAYRLFQKHAVSIGPQKLRSIFEDYILDDQILRWIDEDREWFEFFESKVTYIDNIRNKTGIYKQAKQVMESHGDIEYKYIDWREDDGSITKRKARDKIIYKNPGLIHQIVVDHYGLMIPEREDEGKAYNSIGKFSSIYALELRDFYKASITGIQQQTPTNEQLEYYKGNAIIEKARPTPDGLYQNKATQMDQPNIYN